MRATTTYWGFLLALGLQLPTPAAPPPMPGNQAPAATAPPQAPAPPAAPAKPFALAWNVPLTGTSSAGMAISTGQVHVIAADPENPARLESRARATGDVTWRSDITGWQAVVAGPDSVFGVAGAQVFALDAATGRVRWTNPVAGQQPRLTLEGEWLVVSTSAEIQGFGAAAGGLAWKHESTVPTSTPMTLDGQTATIGFDDGTLVSYVLETGEERWRVRVGSRPVGITTSGGTVYGGLADGTLCAWRGTDGRPAWCHYLRIPVAGAPLATGRLLHVAFRDNELRTYERGSGTLLLHRGLGYRPASGPELSGDAVVVPMATSAFLMFDIAAKPVATINPENPGTSTQLLRTAVARDGGALAALTIPPGGRLTLAMYQGRRE